MISWFFFALFVVSGLSLIAGTWIPFPPLVLILLTAATAGSAAVLYWMGLKETR